MNARQMERRGKIIKMRDRAMPYFQDIYLAVELGKSPEEVLRLAEKMLIDVSLPVMYNPYIHTFDEAVSEAANLICEAKPDGLPDSISEPKERE